MWLMYTPDVPQCWLQMTLSRQSLAAIHCQLPKLLLHLDGQQVEGSLRHCGGLSTPPRVPSVSVVRQAKFECKGMRGRLGRMRMGVP